MKSRLPLNAIKDAKALSPKLVASQERTTLYNKKVRLSAALHRRI